MARVLVAVDFSECGRAALQVGIQLAIDLGCDVRLVHAFPTTIRGPVAAGLGNKQTFLQYAYANETAEAIRLTTEWADKARDQGLDVDIVAEAADPASLILKAADDGVAVVVVGSHGKSGIKKWVLGSVAQDVVQRATVPTLVVPF